MTVNSFNVSMIEHDTLSQGDKDNIIALKSQHWKYSYESHATWIENNLRPGDYHLLLTLNGSSLAGYLNIVDVSCRYDDVEEEMLGIGNVCVEKQYRGTGTGILVMDVAKFFIKAMNKRSVLLCDETLVKFYMKTGWSEFPGAVVICNGPYSKKLMFDRVPDAETLSFNRNF